MTETASERWNRVNRVLHVSHWVITVVLETVVLVTAAFMAYIILTADVSGLTDGETAAIYSAAGVALLCACLVVTRWNRLSRRRNT